MRTAIRTGRRMNSENRPPKAGNSPRSLTRKRPVTGVTTGTLRPEIAAIAVPTTDDGHNMTGDEFSLTAGWGHLGQGEAVMPGQGRAEGRDYTNQERAKMGDAAKTPDDKTVDVYLNDAAYWSNIPEAVWNYKLGGYQVLKKWLSYREHKILTRPLNLDEIQHFYNTARRIAAILELTAGNDVAEQVQAQDR